MAFCHMGTETTGCIFVVIAIDNVVVVVVVIVVVVAILRYLGLVYVLRLA